MNDLVERGGEMAERDGGGVMTLEAMEHQINQIQRLMKRVMKDGVHYGTIPGTDKPALFKSGAEKIGLMFGLRAEYEINQTDLDDGHREYEVICRLHDRTGTHIGSGIGICSTMEKKYRYRADFTGLPVPKEYWETKDQSLLGGPNCAPRKVKGQWQIVRQVEYDNPADFLNTAAKMSKKRAYNDAIITCTAASDFFEQEEVAEAPELHSRPPVEETVDAPRREPQAKQDASGTLTAPQLKVIRKKAEAQGITETLICEEFQADNIENIPAGKANDVLEWLDTVSG